MEPGSEDTLESEGAESDEERRLFDDALSPEQRRAIVQALAQKAGEGDVRIAALLFERLFGRPRAARPAESEETGMVHLDLLKLDDTESENFAHLFEKCIVEERSHGLGEGGGVERGQEAVPA